MIHTPKLFVVSELSSVERPFSISVRRVRERVTEAAERVFGSETQRDGNRNHLARPLSLSCWTLLLINTNGSWRVLSVDRVGHRQGWMGYQFETKRTSFPTLQRSASVSRSRTSNSGFDAVDKHPEVRLSTPPRCSHGPLTSPIQPHNCPVDGSRMKIVGKLVSYLASTKFPSVSLSTLSKSRGRMQRRRVISPSPSPLRLSVVIVD